MKRGSFVGRRTRLNRVSQKVGEERTEFEKVYRLVEEALGPRWYRPDGGRCQNRATYQVGKRYLCGIHSQPRVLQAKRGAPREPA